LRYFFEDTGDINQNESRQKLFSGLQIMDEHELYTCWQTSRPVVSLSLKSMRGGSFSSALDALKRDMSREYSRLKGIALSGADADAAEAYKLIISRKASEEDYKDSLKFLSECLYKSTGKKAVILIDEYDVPLDGAFIGEYYNEMIGFIRSLFESALKTNPYLEFAVITGCLRVSHESVFTGMNNLRVISTLHESFGEYFGFTQTELDGMLNYYDRASRAGDLRVWYNGYRIGGAEVYNPWSVLNCLDYIIPNENAFCLPHWVNTGSNDIVKILIKHTDAGARADLETLMSGGAIDKRVSENVTYDDIERSGVTNSFPKHMKQL
jgi:hypothetical protein